MGSNAARSVPIISWHRPAQRHLVPDLRAAAALPHEKKVGLDFNLAPRSVIDCLCSQLSECVSVWPCEMVDTHHREGKNVRLHLYYMCGWQPVLPSVLVIDSEAECCREGGVSFLQSSFCTDKCLSRRGAPSFSLTPILTSLSPTTLRQFNMTVDCVASVAQGLAP